MASCNKKMCRFCLGVTNVNHAVSIFSKASTVTNLSSVLSTVFQVPVAPDRCLSSYACRKCVDNAKSLYTKLQTFQLMASKSYHTALSLSSESWVTTNLHPTVTSKTNDATNPSEASLTPSLTVAPRHKRTKDTSSGPGISPLTLKSQPPRKRRPDFGKKLFPDEHDEGCTTTRIPLREMDANQAQQNSSRNSDQDHTCSVSTATHLTHPLQPLLQDKQISVNITVTNPSRPLPFSTDLDASLSRIGRALAGENLDTIAKTTFLHPGLKERLIDKVLAMIDAECSVLCSRSQPSVFRRTDISELTNFTWDRYIQEMETKSPILLRLLKLIVSHSDSRNEQKKAAYHSPGICMTAAVMLKERNREMVGVQTHISLALFTSRVHKEVYARLNHVNVSLSYTGTLKVIDQISTLHTVPLKRWISAEDPVKFIGDNINQHRGVRDIRSDHQSCMLNMYSMLVVRCRVSDAEYSPTHCSLSSLDAQSFLPTKQDIHDIKLNLTILVSRILCGYIKCLSPLSKVVPNHIPHTYYSDMCRKSETFFLDVLMKNEAKHSDMVDIMKTQQNYLGDDFPNTSKVLSGGDQLTCERQYCAQRHLMDGDTPRDRLQLLEPVCEDWHALMCLLTIIWKKLFASSSRDHGTLGHFCSLLGRLPNAKKPKENMNACTDILFTVLKGHFIASACTKLGISKPTETPPDFPLLKKREEKLTFITKLARQVVDDTSINGDAILGDDVPKTNDHVYDYGRMFCHFASIALEFHDAWSEGDGDRVCRCWKVLLLHFHCYKHTKYAWEALKLQFQLVSLPPPLACQLKWGRFINTHGGEGNNIPCDLFNEHLNKLFKEIIQNMGANLTDKAMKRAARSVTALHEFTQVFDKQTHVPHNSSAHFTKSDEDDVAQVVSVLLKNKILEVVGGRKHALFTVSENPLSQLDRDKMYQWIERKKKEVIRFKYAVGEGDLSDSDATDDNDDDDDEEQ